MVSENRTAVVTACAAMLPAITPGSERGFPLALHFILAHSGTGVALLPYRGDLHLGARWLGAVMVSLVAMGLLYCTDFPPPPDCRGQGCEDAGHVVVIDPFPPPPPPKADGGLPAPPPDAGGDVGPGPWPLDDVKNYSAAYRLGPIQSAGLDDGFNLWVLSGNRVGVLRPGDAAPTWSENLGQAALGFQSSVICGGRPGQAFVGYIAVDPGSTPEDPNYAPDGFRRFWPSSGDLDSVAIGEGGAPALEEHVNLYNSNDLHWNEASSVLACLKVVRGPAQGDVFIGNNHGVTRLRASGCEASWASQPRHTGYRTCYDDHRHPAWYADKATGAWVPEEGSCWQNGGPTECRLMIGYNYALGVALNGDILTANDFKLGITLTTPDPALQQWHQFGEEPWRLEFYVPDLSAIETPDFWRGFTQAQDGLYYLGSKEFGLWQLTATPRPDGIHLGPSFAKVHGAPSESISALVATDDGSVFIGTAGAGLWRMTPQKTFEPVAGVGGARVRQLAYDPRFTPTMLFALTDAGLFVLRGY